MDPLSVCVAAGEVVEEGRMLYVAREKVRRGRQAGRHLLIRMLVVVWGGGHSSHGHTE